MARRNTGGQVGRPKLDENRTHQPPSNTDLQSSTNFVWVEGRVVVPGWDAKKRVHVDTLHQHAAPLGLVVHEQDATTSDEYDRTYRHWSSRRIPLEEAAAVLVDHPQGLTIQQFAKELYGEKGWTDQHLAAAVKKTYVTLQKLRVKGLVTRSKQGLLFSTSTTKKNPIPPVLMTAVRGVLSEMGENDWPDLVVRKLIRAVAERVQEIP